MNNYFEPGRELPVVREVDVVVAGGGPAGFAAAVSAARNGAKTLLIEATNCVGGMATSGMMSHWTGGTDSPILEEIIQRCAEMPGCEEERKDGAFKLRINHEKQKQAMFDMLENAGAEVWLHTRAVRPVMQDGKICGVITESKSGREVVMAKVTIDSSGDGDIAAQTGAEFTKGREEDGLMQPVTTMFKIAGVDDERAIYPGSFESLVEVPKGEIQALARKELPAPAGHVLLYPSPIPGQVVVNMTNMTSIDGSDTRDLTKAELACRRQIPLIINFLHKYAPGYENCYVIAVAATVGVRETRHFKGLYTITPEDIIEARVFDDWIATRNWFNFDIHSLKGPGLDPNGAQAHFKAKGKYTIPYGACVPQKTDGLLLAGRCISGTHKAHSNFRVMPICANMGQGIGLAAAMAAEQGIEPREVDVKEAQKRLLSQGVQVPESV